jgi:hypothetical protein
MTTYTSNDLINTLIASHLDGATKVKLVRSAVCDNQYHSPFFDPSMENLDFNLLRNFIVECFKTHNLVALPDTYCDHDLFDLWVNLDTEIGSIAFPEPHFCKSCGEALSHSEFEAGKMCCDDPLFGDDEHDEEATDHHDNDETVEDTDPRVSETTMTHPGTGVYIGTSIEKPSLPEISEN